MQYLQSPDTVRYMIYSTEYIISIIVINLFVGHYLNEVPSRDKLVLQIFQYFLCIKNVQILKTKNSLIPLHHYVHTLLIRNKPLILFYTFGISCMYYNTT